MKLPARKKNNVISYKSFLISQFFLYSIYYFLAPFLNDIVIFPLTPIAIDVALRVIAYCRKGSFRSAITPQKHDISSCNSVDKAVLSNAFVLFQTSLTPLPIKPLLSKRLSPLRESSFSGRAPGFFLQRKRIIGGWFPCLVSSG